MVVVLRAKPRQMMTTPTRSVMPVTQSACPRLMPVSHSEGEVVPDEKCDEEGEVRDGGLVEVVGAVAAVDVLSHPIGRPR